MNDISTLREHLFETLAGLRDQKNPMDIERARAVSDVAQTIVNTAKVEIDHMKLTGTASGSGFIPAANVSTPAQITDSSKTATGTKQVTAIPGGNMTIHRMRG